MPKVMEKKTTEKKSTTEERVTECVERRIADCSYRFLFNKITWDYKSGRLILRGCVPSFYLKQVLQEMMRGIEHVDQICNDVDVVSSTGLSSERPR